MYNSEPSSQVQQLVGADSATNPGISRLSRGNLRARRSYANERKTTSVPSRGSRVILFHVFISVHPSPGPGPCPGTRSQ